MYVELDGQKVQAQTLVSHVQHKDIVTFNITLNKIPMQLVATRSVDAQLVIVIAAMSIETPLNEYRLRWLIELFFKSIKSKGFHFEDTHMSDPESIKKLFALTTLATLITVQAGTLKHCFVKKISIKNHGRPTYSLFTYGLDFIKDLFDGDTFYELKTALINFLAPPKNMKALC